MWCSGMRHSAPWWMTVVCVGLASFEASSRVSGWTGPATGGRVRVSGRWVRRAVSLGWVGGAAFCVPVGCLHVFASWQSVSRYSCRLPEVLVEEAVLRPFGNLQEGVWCARLWWRTRILGRVTHTTVMEAPMRSMVLMVPSG